MSLIYGMETFFLPRGLLMHSSSLSFQKTHIFHTGSYILEFMLLLVLLLLGATVYIYANVKQNVEPIKSNKMKKSRSPSPKVLAKIKNAAKSVAEKPPPPAPPKMTTPTTSIAMTGATPPPTNKKRSSSGSSPQSTVTSSPRKKKAGSRLTFPHHARLKNDALRKSTADCEKVTAVNASATKSVCCNGTDFRPRRSHPAAEPQPRNRVEQVVIQEADALEQPAVAAAREAEPESRGRRRRQAPVEEPPTLLYRGEVYYIQQPMLFPLLTWTFEDETFLSQLSAFLLPSNRLPYLGFPFMTYYPNYGVFFNATPSLYNYPLTKGLLEDFADSSDLDSLREWVHNELQLNQYFQNADVREKRECCRCKSKFFISNNGQCWYHRGRLLHNFTDPSLTRYSCCETPKNSPGCTSANDHVWNGLVPGINGPIRGFVVTEPPTNPETRHPVVAVDCEMCYTTQGLELTRVTLVSIHGKVIYDTLVKPEHPIIDYNTKFSGITREILERPGASKPFFQVQHEILQLVDAATILIGHGLENDLRALKIVHYTVIDTSLVNPERSDTKTPKRVSLKNLSQWYLNRRIQDNEKGHDSVEDARACLDLVKFMVNSEKKPDIISR